MPMIYENKQVIQQWKTINFQVTSKFLVLTRDNDITENGFLPSITIKIKLVKKLTHTVIS